MGCVLLWCDVVLCYAVLYGRRNLTKKPSLKLSGKSPKTLNSCLPLLGESPVLSSGCQGDRAESPCSAGDGAKGLLGFRA